MTTNVCRTCKKGPGLDQPLARCEKCAFRYHSCCHRPTPQSAQQSNWTCSRCSRSVEEKSRYDQISSVSSFASTRSHRSSHPSHPSARSGSSEGFSGPQPNKMGQERPQPRFGAQCHHPGCSSTIMTTGHYCTKHRDPGRERDVSPSQDRRPPVQRSFVDKNAVDSDRSRAPANSDQIAAAQYRNQGLSPKMSQPGSSRSTGLPANSRLGPEFREKAAKTARKGTKSPLFRRIGGGSRPRSKISPPHVNRTTSQAQTSSIGQKHESLQTPSKPGFSLHPNKGLGPPKFRYDPPPRPHASASASQQPPAAPQPMLNQSASIEKTSLEDHLSSPRSRINRVSANQPPQNQPTGISNGISTGPSTIWDGTVYHPTPPKNAGSSHNSGQEEAKEVERKSHSSVTGKRGTGKVIRELEAKAERWRSKNGTSAEETPTIRSNQSSEVPTAPAVVASRTNGPFSNVEWLSANRGDSQPETLTARKRPRSPDAATPSTGTTAAKPLSSTPPPEAVNGDTRSDGTFVRKLAPLPQAAAATGRSMSGPGSGGPPSKKRRERPPNRRKPTVEQLRSKLVADFDQAKFDVAFYGQEGANQPPPGVNVPSRHDPGGKPALLPPPGEDGRLYLNFDPRIHWPRDWDDTWYEWKMRRIQARGGKKAYFGDPVGRLRDIRRLEERFAATGAAATNSNCGDLDDDDDHRNGADKGGQTAGNRRHPEPQPWSHSRLVDFGDVPEDELPEYVKGNADWVRVCAWMRSTRQKTLARDREAERLLESDQGIKHLLGPSGW